MTDNPNTPANVPAGPPPGNRLVYHPGIDGTTVDLVEDPTRFTVTFGTERAPLSPTAQAVLREHSAPVAQIPHYGIRVYEGGSGSARSGAVAVLNRERAVELAAPVLRRHTADGDEVYVTRFVLVQFWPEVSRATIDALNRDLGAEIVADLEYAPNGFKVLAPAEGGGTGAFGLAEAYRATGLTRFSHPDLVSPRHRRTATMTEPATKSVIAVRDADYLAQQWHLTMARVTDAWALTTGSPAITIAILDDGIDVTHPEFSGRIGAQWDFTAGVADGNPKTDDDKHGTACAGVAGARGLRASGAAPECSLMAVRFPATLGDSDEADMFRWAADNGADVISCSWGPADGTGQSDPLPGATQTAIQYARTAGRGGKGTAIVWAAGNGNESVDLDGYASNPHVLAIAACNDRQVRSWYSDMGDAIHVCAPSSGDRSAGEKAITTTDRQGASGYNDGAEGVDADYTNSFGGTSSATPLVAGIVGLMLSANPDLTATQVRQILADTARKIDTGYDANGHSPDYGYGLVDAYEAVRAAQAATSTTPAATPPATGTPTISAPATLARASGPPQFDVDPGGGSAIYYAVEVATSSDLLDGGEHGDDPGFYATWQDSAFQSSNPYVLPDAVWERLCGADALYYRAWFSSSSDAWTDTVVTTENESSASAPMIALTGSTGVRSRGERGPATKDAAAPTHAGLDRLTYPGDDVMRALYDHTNLAWTGFYLAPSPSQGYTGWMTKAQILRDMGWGLAPIYVGQQWSSGPGSHVLTAAQGTIDAQQAIGLADTAAIGENCVIYLDIEIGGRLPAAFLAYCQAWFDGVRGSRYRPGVYCSHLDTPAQLQAKNPDLFFWVFNIDRFAKTQALDADGSFRVPPIDGSGCAFATAWQFIQGAPSIPVPHGDGTTGSLATVDLDCATVLDPSQPTTAQAGPTPATPAAAPTVTGPVTADRAGPAPQFSLDPGEGSASIYYAVEVATDRALLDGGDHTLADGFYGSWQDSAFLSSNPYQLPDAAWQALCGADALYYRAWFSSSQTDWADTTVTAANEDTAAAGELRIVDAPADRSRRSPAERSPRSRDVAPAHPTVAGPPSARRGGRPPVFTVGLPPAARSWRLEVSADLRAFDIGGPPRTPQTFWASDVLAASVATTALTIDAWTALQGADRLYYRVCTSPAPAGEGWYEQDSSTSGLAPDSAPWVDLLAPERLRTVADGPTKVTDPDETHWRGDLVR